jgi:gluconate kinase
MFFGYRMWLSQCKRAAKNQSKTFLTICQTLKRSHRTSSDRDKRRNNEQNVKLMMTELLHYGLYYASKYTIIT